MLQSTFPPHDEFGFHESEEEKMRIKQLQRARLAEIAKSVSAALVAATAAEQEERMKKPSPSHTISVRMPIKLLQQLNAVASDAATGRSHLIRQIVTDYLNSMEDQGIRFGGCLLRVDNMSQR
jgi:predicted DNA-binding protein